MMNRKAVCAVLAVLLPCLLQIAFGQNVHSPEQTRFSAEDDAVQRPVLVSREVLAVLKHDDLVRNELEYEKIPAEEIPLSWFSSSIIHLSSHEEADLVVMAVGALRGANVTTFWVFRGTAQGYELVLNAPAHDLTVESTRWHGYRDITLASATAVRASTLRFRFDGKHYKEYKSTVEPIQ